MDLTIQDVLKPVPGHEIWDYIVYGLFILGLVTLFALGEKGSQRDTIMVSVAIFICVLDKAYAWGYIMDPQGVFPQGPGGEFTRQQRIDAHISHFGTYAMRVLLFSLPIVVAAQTKAKAGRALAGLMAIAGAIYSFGRWYDEQRNAGGSSGVVWMITEEPQVLMAHGSFLLALGELFCRRYLRVNWGYPVAIVRMLAPYHTEVQIPQVLDNRPHLAITNGTMVNLDNRRNLDTGSTEKGFFRHIKFSAVQRALDNF